jgi:hypothetical protein
MPCVAAPYVLVIKSKRNSPIAPQSGPNFSAKFECFWNFERFIRGSSMLVARRDPPSHGDPRDAASAEHHLFPAARAPRLTRFVTVIQMVGSLLAVPVGIASAYSFYLANFSPETTCQSLRGGIVAMLDKNVDAATRRILVRHDVEAFEKACGSVDPDATAAFKTLLDVDKVRASARASVAPAPAVSKMQHIETAPKDAARKAEQRPQTVAKQPAQGTAAGVTEIARRDAAVSDTQWLDAVRQALVTHKPEPAAEAVKARTLREPAAQPPPHEAVTTVPATDAAVAPNLAPTLPPAISIAPSSARPADADHPVPPGSIPNLAPAPERMAAAKSEENGRSRIRKWISEIPLLGSAVENAAQ